MPAPDRVLQLVDHKLDQNAAPAFQLRRYAWSASLPLSILTDFEEFAVYDGRYEPSQFDLPTAARVDYLKYTDYAARGCRPRRAA